MKYLLKLLALTLCVVLLGGCVPERPYNTIRLPYSVEFTPENHSNLREGRMTFTVTGICTIDNINDLPKEGGIKIGQPHPSVYIIYCNHDRDDHRHDTIPYPECVREDGTFALDSYMVLVEYTVTNHDAAQWTADDLDENGKPESYRTDPYLFGLIWGFDLEYTPNHSLVDSAGTFAYFSGYDADYKSGVRILPGETKEFIIGYFVSEKCMTGKPYDVSELYLTVPSGELGRYINLSVGENLQEK